MKKSIIIFVISLLLINCSKNDTSPPKVYEEEKPFEGFKTATGVNKEIAFSLTNSYEYGFQFSSKVNGKIKAIKVNLPNVSNVSIRFSIWDYQTKERLYNLAFSQLVAVRGEKIIEFKIEKDRRYLISMNSKNWYQRKKMDDSNLNYPIQIGNITYYSYQEIQCTDTQVLFPSVVKTFFYNGDLDFTFQQTD